jgi:hypothetical protein
MSAPDPPFYTVIGYLALVEAAAALWGALIVVFRAILLRSALKLPTDKMHSLKRNIQRLERLTRIILITSPFWMIPTAYFIDGLGQRMPGPVSALYVLLYVTIIEAYVYSRWLARKLAEQGEHKLAAA